ncbi:protein aurora borealis [Euwallacea fornicatus]|uniref:protein aurora borealis n=1 Tax=Euwallacea fornicatus TaxID=995702 RepID=UPI00338DE3AC
MDFKHMCESYATPKSDVNLLRKRISQGVVTDSPFRNMPKFSTPPSRFTKIKNPFEPQLTDRLHLPTFSPNVFVHNSTARHDEKFKWTIEDISALKPADIDETTVNQHICNDDPHIESEIQQKIETYFNKTPIVPSPMGIKTSSNCLLKGCGSSEENVGETNLAQASVKKTCESVTQTVLTLPPVLPDDVEDMLKPYFLFDEEVHISNNISANSSLYKKLFEDKSPEVLATTEYDSVDSSPSRSINTSLIQFSPCSRSIDGPFDISDCNLSPINRSSLNRKLAPNKSVCRLEFCENMSVDNSLMVPDMDTTKSPLIALRDDESYGSSLKLSQASVQDMSANWSIEDKDIFIDTRGGSSDPNKMDVSNSNTPNSKLYIGKGQRKRLSESFKVEELECSDNAMSYEDIATKSRRKIFKNDFTDTGYYTQDTDDFTNNHITNVFASTPSKRYNKLGI